MADESPVCHNFWELHSEALPLWLRPQYYRALNYFPIGFSPWEPFAAKVKLKADGKFSVFHMPPPIPRTHIDKKVLPSGYLR